MAKKETVGKQLQDHLQKKHDRMSVVELTRQIQGDHVNILIDVINKSKQVWNGDFYISLLPKLEKSLAYKAIRSYFKADYACPSPHYDQSVFKYHAQDENLEFIWTVPDKDTVEYYIHFANEVVPEERELLGFCIAFKNGLLNDVCNQLNGEKKDSIILEA